MLSHTGKFLANSDSILSYLQCQTIIFCKKKSPFIIKIKSLPSTLSPNTEFKGVRSITIVFTFLSKIVLEKRELSGEEWLRMSWVKNFLFN